MNLLCKKSSLHGHITVPGSKSHTIRALLLASLADGVTVIENPLPSADCISSANAIPLIGAKVEGIMSAVAESSAADLCASGASDTWTVTGAGTDAHLPSDVVNVGNSGSLLYFMSPIAATFSGWSIFTGDESIRSRPIGHVVDALRQLGAEAHISRPDKNSAPFILRGPISTENEVTTGGQLSQYISGMMMAATRMDGTLKINLTDPKETPYLTMTRLWLESYGVPVKISSDFKRVEVTGKVSLAGGKRVIPSDWEAVAFPLIAALVSESEITIDNVDSSGSQGDDAIVAVLQSVGADITWDKSANTLLVKGGKRLSTERLPNNELRVAMAGFPDAICALAAVACFIEGTVILEDADVCRHKETDRISVLAKGLRSLGADTEEGSDFLVIHGHSPKLADGSANPAFKIHGGTLESYDDHRIAMSYACLGCGLPEGEKIIVKDAECCAVSFPHFVERMRGIRADFSPMTDARLDR